MNPGAAALALTMGDRPGSDLTFRSLPGVTATVWTCPRFSGSAIQLA
jgi:hypothetical protein